MAYGKKPMTDNEKKAKLSVLKDAHKTASSALKDRVYKYKDSKDLKKHVKDMSDESGIDFKGDSDKIVDPGMDGDVIGRHISDENIDHCDTDSVYDIDEIDARIRDLVAQKEKAKKGR